MKGSSEPGDAWWTGYFDETFLRIYRSILSAEQTAPEIDAIGELVDRPGGRVLDVGCGWGRHALELARSGFRVTGLDYSPTLLAEASRRAAGAGVDLDLVRADMRDLPFRAAFDAALSLFSSLGYFLDEDEDRRVLDGIRRVVVPGGLFLLETMHRDLIAREYAERDWWETPDGDTVWVVRDFDAVAGVSHETLRWRAADGTEGAKTHTIRVRSASEWNSLLRRAGWMPTDWFGSWDLVPFTPDAERLIVVARAQRG